MGNVLLCLSDECWFRQSDGSIKNGEFVHKCPVLGSGKRARAFPLPSLHPRRKVFEFQYVITHMTPVALCNE